MPATQLQLAANRRNAALSTGPRTSNGKRRSSLNAYTHGLTGQTVVLPHEDLAAYQSLCHGFFQDFDPQTAIEKQLVQTLVDSQWLLNRCHSHELSLFALADVHQSETAAALASARHLSAITHQIEVLSRHGQRLSRRFQVTLKQLIDVQDRRKQQERAEMKDAVLLAKLYKMKEQHYEPAEFGFVLKKHQIDLYTRRTQAIEEAKQASAASVLTCYAKKG